MNVGGYSAVPPSKVFKFFNFLSFLTITTFNSCYKGSKLESVASSSLGNNSSRRRRFAPTALDSLGDELVSPWNQYIH